MALKYSPQGKAGVSSASSFGPIMLYCFEKSRSSTGVREFCASRVWTANTVCAFFAARSGLSPTSWNMRFMCSTSGSAMPR